MSSRTTPNILAPEVSAEDKKLLAKIEELQGKKYLPEQMLALVAAVSRLQNNYLPKVSFAAGKQSLPGETLQKLSSREQRHNGLPILSGKDFPLDMLQVQETARALLDLISTTAPDLGTYAPELAAMLDAQPDLLEETCHEILDRSLLDKNLPRLASWAETYPNAPYFLRFVATSAAMPSIATVGRILGEEHDSEKVWLHGHCPVCGNHPLLGRLVDKEGRRMHSCSFCSFEYRVPRMGCPFCLEPESDGSEYLISEDEPGYLLTVCKGCTTYFKVGDFRAYGRPWFPLLDDFSSLSLDMHAMRLGYKRPTLSGWGF